MSSLIITGIILIMIDSIYLTIIKSYFQKQIQQVQHTPFELKLMGVILCYILLIFGINYFIIKPNRSILSAFLLGIVIYGVFETTNYALLKKWTLTSVFIDTLWGGILFAITTYIYIFLENNNIFTKIT